MPFRRTLRAMRPDTRATTRHLAVLVLTGAVVLPAGAAAAATPPAVPAAVPAATRSAAPTATTRIVVRGLPGTQRAAERAVAAVGGRVTRRLPIIDGVAALVPAGALGRLRTSPGVADVTPDAAGRVLGLDPVLGYDTATDTGGLPLIRAIVGADKLWAKGWTGKGVDVAVIDTGVAPVKGLTSGNVVNGPDLSFDSQRADLRHKDGFGHGTHMASIIAGRDTAGSVASYATPGTFTGLAPDARVVSVRVGASDGMADVSQVIAAIGWVAENRNRNGLNIRVLNLSFGTDGTQDWRLDPLAYAAEAAWRRGVLVVVAAGNDGTTKTELANPAMDPNLLAVGASDPQGTVTTSDDVLPAFSNRGTARRYVDVVAPGVRVLGLRDPNGLVDQTYPASRVGNRLTRGSGTSQATAVVSGAAALLIGAYPSLTPNQVKNALVATAKVSPVGTPKRMGAGIVNVAGAAALVAAGGASPAGSPAGLGQGTGTLEGARGSVHAEDRGIALVGEKDIFGRAWAPSTFASRTTAGTTWTAGTWNGSTWTGSSWTATGDWATSSWSGTSWAGITWGGRTWTSRTFAANSWDGRSWVSEGWSGRSWVADAWSGRSWVSAAWASGAWG
jgi:serine protease AprX